VLASAFSGAGSSIVGRMIAEYLQSFGLQVGIVESPFAPYSWYELIHASKLIRESKKDLHEWRSWHRQIAEEETVELDTELKSNGVGYIIKKREDNLESWDLMKTADLVGFSRHYPILFYDMSTGISDEREKIILRQANKVILVSGYDPLRVNREHREYKDVLSGIVKGKLIVLANKSSSWLKISVWGKSHLFSAGYPIYARSLHEWGVVLGEFFHQK
jgi:hypothetical protein